MDLSFECQQDKVTQANQYPKSNVQSKQKRLSNIAKLLQTPSKIPKLSSKDSSHQDSISRYRSYSHYGDSQNKIFQTKIPKLSKLPSNDGFSKNIKQLELDEQEQLKTPNLNLTANNFMSSQNLSTLDSSTQQKGKKISMFKRLNRSASQSYAAISDSSNSSDDDDFLRHSGQFKKSNISKQGSNKKFFFRKSIKPTATAVNFMSDQEELKGSHSNDDDNDSTLVVKKKNPTKKRPQLNKTFATGFTQPIKEQLTADQKVVLNQKQKRYIKQLNANKPPNSLSKINTLIFTHIFVYLQTQQIFKVAKVCRNIRSCLMRQSLWRVIYHRYPKELLIHSDHSLPKFKLKPGIPSNPDKTMMMMSTFSQFQQLKQDDPLQANQKYLNPNQHPLKLNEKVFFSGKNLSCYQFENAQQFKKNYILERGIPSNIQKGKYQLFKLIGHQSDIRAIDSQGHEVVTGSKDSHVMYWNMDRKRTFVMPEHSNSIDCVQLLSKCQRIVSSAGDRQVIISSYQDKNYPEIIAKKSHKYKVNGIRKFRDNTVLSYGDDNALRVWNAQSGEIRLTIQNAHSVNKRVNFVATQKLNSSFCVSTDHAQVKLWDIEQGVCTFSIGDQDNWKPQSAKSAKYPYEIHSVALSTDNLLFTGEKKVIRLWDLREAVKKSKAAAYQQKLGEQWLEQFKEQKHEAFAPNIEDLKCDYQTDIKKKYYNFSIGTYPSRIKYIENYSMIVAMASTNNKIISYDIRRGQKLDWYQTHHYPITSFDTGKTLMTSHIAAVAGRNKGYHFCLKFIDLLKREEMQPWEKVINPAQNSAIMKVFFGDEVVVTGSRDGGVTAMDLKMGRQYLSNRPLILKNVPPS